jgi:hypothetical protein
MDLTVFSSFERKALVLLRAYETERRKHQLGYRAVKQITPEVKDSPVFKQFVTVVKWLEELGFSVTWKEVHWVGYVEYIFKSVRPMIPQPGQLKNQMLLNQYLKSIPDTEIPESSIEPVYYIYSKILNPKILNDVRILYQLGLEGVVLALDKTQKSIMT